MVGEKLLEILEATPELFGSRFVSLLSTPIQRAVRKVHRDLLPLPVSHDSVEEFERRVNNSVDVALRDAKEPFYQDSSRAAKRTTGSRAWLRLVIHGLNAGFGASFASKKELSGLQLRTEQLDAMAELETSILYFLELPDGKVPAEDWGEKLKATQFSYEAGASARAEKVSWAQVEPKLPPAEFTAAIDAVRLASGPVRDFLLHPRKAMIDLEKIAECPPAGKILSAPGADAEIGRGLLKRGMVRALRAHELIMVGGKPLLNGFFC